MKYSSICHLLFTQFELEFVLGRQIVRCLVVQPPPATGIALAPEPIREDLRNEPCHLRDLIDLLLVALSDRIEHFVL